MHALSYLGAVHQFGDVLVTAVQMDGNTYRVDDTPRPYEDGVTFGRDQSEPGDIKLRLLLTYQGERNIKDGRLALREAAYRFLSVWDAKELREQSGAVAELTLPELGTFTGRPRRAEWTWSTFGLGYLLGTATFVRDDSSVYDADGAWHEVTVGLVTEQRDGFVFPIEFPLTTAVSDSRAQSFLVGGVNPVWPVLTVRGPLLEGASVEITGLWSMRLGIELAYDEVVEIDTRPGARLMTVNGLPYNVLSPGGVRLAEAHIPAGPHQIALRGTSPTGAATATLRWRENTIGGTG